jgi:hypothetical protein
MIYLPRAFVLVCIYLFAWHIQSQFILHADISWLVLASGRMLAGGTYAQNFFETNPPMILYIYAPVVLALKLFSVSTAVAVRAYVFILASLSLALCFALLRKIFSKDSTSRSILFFALAAIFFLLPQNEFGQREHILILFSMPYFLLTALRWENNTVKSRYAVLAGLLAGISFGMKPFFLIPSVLLESYYLLRWRNLRSVLRLENITIAGVLTIYLIVIYFRHSDYLHIVIPLLSQFYYQKFRLPAIEMLLSQQACFTYFALAFFLIRYSYNSYKTLCSVLAISALGFFFTYFIQGQLWYYHALPAFALNALLFTLLFAQLIQQKTFSKYEVFFLSVFGGSFFCYLTLRTDFVRQAILYYPSAYFLLFGTVFAALLYFWRAERNISSTLLAVTFILITSFLFYENSLYTQLHYHIFLLTTILLSLSFIFFIPKQKLTCACLAILGITIFSFPFDQAGYLYMAGMNYKMLYASLRNELNHYPQKSIYLLSNSEELSFPSLEDTHHTLQSRFACLLGWLPMLPETDDDAHYHKLYAENSALYHFFLTALVTDLNHSKPDFIFVDRRNTGEGLKKRRYLGYQQIDYLKFFAQEKIFQDFWKDYHYVKTADGQPFFRFDIYQRS